MRLVFLDSGPLGELTSPLGRPRADACRRWARDLLVAGVRVFVPEIADFEVRREVIRLGATAGLRRLDQARSGLEFSPITTDVMLLAAEFSADARRLGKPTASPDALDADCILAAQATLASGPGDVVTVATSNVGHLARFVDARTWEQIGF
jgi:predicted nucleic acid-binding protein